MKLFLAFMGAVLLIGGVAWYGHRALDVPPLDAEIQRVVAQLPSAIAVGQVETLLTDAGTIITLRCAFVSAQSIPNGPSSLRRMINPFR